MIIKVILIFGLTILQNIFLVSTVYSAEKYIEIDKIIAIVETQTITNSDLNKKKEATIKALSRQDKDVPSDKKLQNYR